MEGSWDRAPGTAQCDVSVPHPHPRAFSNSHGTGHAVTKATTARRLTQARGRGVRGARGTLTDNDHWEGLSAAASETVLHRGAHGCSW